MLLWMTGVTMIGQVLRVRRRGVGTGVNEGRAEKAGSL